MGHRKGLSRRPGGMGVASTLLRTVRLVRSSPTLDVVEGSALGFPDDFGTE